MRSYITNGDYKVEAYVVNCQIRGSRVAESPVNLVEVLTLIQNFKLPSIRRL